MGGGKLKRSILEHMEKGYDVVMEAKCAKTIRDDLEQVKSYGIKIADENKSYEGYTKIHLGDINIKKLSEFVLGYDLDFDIDKIAIAVQDHGYNENMGDRDFRFEKIREKLSEPVEPESFGFNGNVPDYYSRMKSVESALKKEGIEETPLLMDTKFASIAGMCYDEEALKLNSFIAIDIGNGHTTAASIENGKIQGLFEHHTSNLTGESLENYINRLASGEITNEEIYNDHGHGAHVLNPITKLEKVIVSGPKRELIEKVAEKNGTSKVEAAKAVNAVIGTMAETLKKGEKISLLELGSFAIRERKERNGYNPNSKENMVIPAKKVVKFSIGKYFFD